MFYFMFKSTLYIYPVLHVHVYTAIPKGQSNETLNIEH